MRTWTPRPNPNNIQPARHVTNAAGRIKPHPYETPHDEPSGTGPCWFCVLPQDHPAHRRDRKKSPPR